MEVRKIENSDTEPWKTQRRKMDESQMQQDMNYMFAQRILSRMRDDGLITVDEFNKITALNRKTFSPYLAELYD